MRYIPFILLLCMLHINVYAQPEPKPNSPDINKFDASGNRQGLWLLQFPAAMGEPAYSAWGNYYRGRKMGIWYRMDADYEITAIENYKNNTLDGEAKYFDNGRLVCVGHYRGLNPEQLLDTVAVLDPVTGLETLRSISTERGSLRHGIWRFYDPKNGRMVREEEYQVDSLIYKKEFLMSSADSAYYKRREQGMPHNKPVKTTRSTSNLK